MVIVYSCLREFIVLSSNTTIPPPPTVSIVLANKLGVRASKSCVRDNKSSQSLIYWLHGIYVNKKVVVATHCVDFHTGDKQSEMEALSFSQGWKTHLQDTHAEGVSQDLVCLVVVTVSDGGCGNKQFKWVIRIQIQRASF